MIDPQAVRALGQIVASDEVKQALEQIASEIVRLRAALEAIKQATLDGKVCKICDDVAWFSDIETLHDFCEHTLNPEPVR